MGIFRKELFSNLIRRVFSFFKNLWSQTKRLSRNDRKRLVLASKRRTQPGINIREISKLSKRRRGYDGKETWTNKPGNIIELINVSKVYVLGKEVNEILRDVSFEIKEGEMVALFGRSGSGKSTLLNLISGLDRPTEGYIIVKDRNLPYLSSRELTEFRRANVSFIFQYHDLLQNISCFDNADTGFYLQEDSSRKVDLIELFKKFEVEHQLHRYPSQISGGQKQRVAIIRALAKNAPILFADEPTASLDQKTSDIVIEYFKELQAKYRTTVIIISHDPKILTFVDKVIFVENQGVRVEEKIKDLEEINKNQDQAKNQERAAKLDLNLSAKTSKTKLASKSLEDQKTSKKEAALANKTKRISNTKTKATRKSNKKNSSKEKS